MHPSFESYSGSSMAGHASQLFLSLAMTSLLRRETDGSGAVGY